MRISVLAPVCATLALCAGSITIPPADAQLSPNATVYASGLAGPRGLKFGPDGYLYVAEAGFGGGNSTAGRCAQVIPPIGPYTGAYTARISKIDRAGHVSTVASHFPSSQSSDATKDTSGVADLTFLDGRLYAVLAGGGCSHGFASTPNGIVLVDTRTGSWKIIANLSEFLENHPVMYPNLPDFEPDGTFYSLIAHDGVLYTVEPNHGQVISITPRGEMSQVIDVSKAEGHIVPTAIAEKDGNFYVGNLGTFPINPTASKILTLSSGRSESHVPGLDTEDWHQFRVAGSRAGFATVVSVQFGPDGLLYALELSPAAGDPALGLGKVVRLNADGEIEDIATGLSVPSAMTFGPQTLCFEFRRSARRARPDSACHPAVGVAAKTVIGSSNRNRSEQLALRSTG
jgi:hypothetical protein